MMRSVWGRCLHRHEQGRCGRRRQSLGGARAIVTTIGHVQAVAALMDALAAQGKLVLLNFRSQFVISGRRSRPDRETARGRSFAGADPGSQWVGMNISWRPLRRAK